MEDKHDTRKGQLLHRTADLMRSSTEHLIAESDRAFVILAAIQIDELLRDTLVKCFATPTSKEDGLFDDGRGILRDFNAKIEISYRLGLFSPDFVKALHELRRIRNICAHSGQNFVLADPRVRDRISNLKELLQESKELSDRQGEDLKQHRDYIEKVLNEKPSNPHRKVTDELLDLAVCVLEMLMSLSMVKEIVAPYTGPRFDDDFYKSLWKI